MVVTIDTLPAVSPGTLLLLLAEFEHSRACFFALGARGKRAERVADEAVDALAWFLKRDGAVDQWLADQLLLPLAAAGGTSVIRTAGVTRHLLTDAEVIRRFLPVGIDACGPLDTVATVRVQPRTAA